MSARRRRNGRASTEGGQLENISATGVLAIMQSRTKALNSRVLENKLSPWGISAILMLLWKGCFSWFVV